MGIEELKQDLLTKEFPDGPFEIMPGMVVEDLEAFVAIHMGRLNDPKKRNWSFQLLVKLNEKL